MTTALEVPPGYAAFDEAALRAWVQARPGLAGRLGGEPAAWRVEEVSDGNLNLVFILRGPAGGLCVKQSLPYVRVAGEGWPMPLERVWFEYRHLAEAGAHVPGLVPALIDYDPQRFALVMELLPEHRILRRALVDGERHPNAALAVAEYAARTAVATSVLGEPFDAVFERGAVFARNVALTRITAELVFRDPLIEHPRNRWTSPQLDATAAEFRADAALRLAVARLGHHFLTVHEALLHGDLHTGSVMVGHGGCAGDTRVIDSEFALYGPVGFDLGNFVANLLMAFFAQPGHAHRPGERDALAEWLLGEVGRFWQHFAQRHEALWQARSAQSPEVDAYPASLFADAAGQALLADERRAVQAGLLRDLVGYAGTEILRRILGFAHNLDFEAIADADRRADAERRALHLARQLLLMPQHFKGIDDIVAAARLQAAA